MISTQILIYTIFNTFCDSNVVIRKAPHSLTGARVISTFSVRIETAAIVFEQKMATSDEDAAHWSAIQFCFPSRLTPMDTFCQLKSTDNYKNVSRTPAYNWNGRFIDGSTDNISRGRPKYKNCRKMKSAHDGIDCHWRRIVLEVAEMSGISKYTAQHTLTSDFSVTLERSLHLIDFLKLFIKLFEQQLHTYRFP